MPKIYLAGPINHCTYEQATEWRDYVSRCIDSVEFLDPMRNKQYLQNLSIMGTNSYQGKLETTDRGIITDDYNDVLHSDLVFVNLLNAPKVSAGTCMELGWCYHLRIPTVVIMEKTGNVYEHPMVREAISYRTESLDDGIRLTKHILNIKL